MKIEYLNLVVFTATFYEYNLPVYYNSTSLSYSTILLLLLYGWVLLKLKLVGAYIAGLILYSIKVA